jgi:hypothetical protein
MKRTPLVRASALTRRGKPLKRKTPIRRIRPDRARARRERDFGSAAAIVRAQPCCVCVRWDTKQSGKTEAHHEPPRSTGGRSADLLPLCTRCHRRRHRLGATGFWNEAGMSWQLVVERMRALVALNTNTARTTEVEGQTA